jgi:hypothetical protein
VPLSCLFNGDTHCQDISTTEQKEIVQVILRMVNEFLSKLMQA